MRVLVTHATESLAFHLVHRLLAEGNEVCAVLYPDPGDAWAMERGQALPQVTRAEAVSDGALCRAVTEFRPDAVVYFGFAARDAEPTLTDVGARLAELSELFDTAKERGVRHVVLASGAAVYGATDKLPFAVGQPYERPLSVEGSAQRSAELLGLAAAQSLGVAVTSLRFFTVYGPFGRPGQSVLRFARALSAGEAVTLDAGGTLRRDFTFIDDAVEVLIRALERPPETAEHAPAFAAHNVGTGTPTPVARALEVVEEAMGRTAERREGEASAHALPHTWADVRELQHAYGFRPRTALGEGVHKTVAWLLAHPHLTR